MRYLFSFPSPFREGSQGADKALYSTKKIIASKVFCVSLEILQAKFVSNTTHIWKNSVMHLKVQCWSKVKVCDATADAICTKASLIKINFAMRVKNFFKSIMT